jgi:ABC-type Mn2+/Zn2+ transport system ATPase subunit
MLITLEDTLFGYGDKPVVRVDRLELAARRCVGVFGPNGSGKTTLVAGATGLLQPLTGRVIRARDDLRITYLPQQRAMDRAWPMTGLDAAALSVSARRRLGWVGQDRQELLGAMRALGVEELAGRSFAKLSGGQQQRVLLAGAMAADPHLLVLDEPTDGLDAHSCDALLGLLRGYVRQGLAMLLISHEVDELLVVCEQIAWLHPPPSSDEPSVVEIVSPDELRQRATQARNVAIAAREENEAVIR